MDNALEVMRAIERAPLRTVRYEDLKGLGTNVWRTLNKLVEQGALARLVRGIYCAPPDGRDSREWTPSIEAAGLAVATARHGNRNAILMGIGAARHWGVLPRALTWTMVAVPTSGYRPVVTSGGTVHFVARDLDRLEAVVDRTELGDALVTTSAQTLLDLLSRPRQGGNPEAVAEAVRNLAAQVDASDFANVVNAATRVNEATRAMAASLKARS